MLANDLLARGLVLLGCGKMGSAMLSGWLADGLPADKVYVIDPNPSDWLRATGVHINTDLPPSPALALIAVKPQMMGKALPALQAFTAGETIYLSVAAGTPITAFEAVLGAEAVIIRAMPNTPAAVAKGITAIVGNRLVTETHLALAETLLGAIGQTVRLENEAQIDAVTGVSGSGPAYVFHMIEAMAAAGEAEGLAPELAMTLAKATVAGAGVLAEIADESPSQLRVNVTSPNGTTQAGLDVLMQRDTGLAQLMKETVRAAAERSRALSRE